MYRTPENLKPAGDIELFPEYRSAYVSYDLKKLYDSDKMLNEKYEIVEVPTKITNIEADTSGKTVAPATIPTTSAEIKAKLENAHLNLRGQQDLLLEYKSQYVAPTNVEKSQSIPQLNNLRSPLGDSFDRSPSEYKENFHSYENFIKSVPIKKQDNLNMKGKFVGNPEYSENYKEVDLTKFERRNPVKSEDHFRVNYRRNSKNEVVDEPVKRAEYFESFQDPHITCKPEKMKPRRSHLELHGSLEYKPEYKTTYVDFPRARPIIKKPKSNINLYTGYTASTPSKYGEKAMLPNYHHANTASYSSDEQVPLECQPEYRKARREFMLRERERANNSLLDYLEKNAVNLPPQSSTEIENSDETTDERQPSVKGTRRSSTPQRVRSSRTIPRRPEIVTETSIDSMVSVSARPSSRSPSKSGFRYTVEHVDAPKRVVKYGRRSSQASHSDTVASNSARARHQTRVIEGNPNYIRDTTENYRRQQQLQQQQKVLQMPAAGRVYNQPNDRDRAFVVLQEPCKRSAWMKPTWYDP